MMNKIKVEVKMESPDAAEAAYGNYSLENSNFQDLNHEAEEECLAEMEELKYEEPTTVSESNINFSTLSSFCRLCANQKTDMLDIFDDTNEMPKIFVGKMRYCLPVTVLKSDILPNRACWTCLEKLESCYQFLESVIVAENKLLTLCPQKSNVKYEEAEKNLKSSVAIRDGVRHTNTEETYSKPPNEDIQSNYNGTTITPASDLNESLVSAEWKSPDSALNNLSQTVDNRQKLLPAKAKNLPPNSNGCSPPKTRSRRSLDAVKEKIKKHDIGVSKNRKEKSRDETVANKNTGSEVISCRVCDETFATRDQCYTHSSIHWSINEYPCSFCGKTFMTKATWTRHNHQDDPGRLCKSVFLKCDLCGVKYGCKQSLMKHKRTHKSRVAPCKKCDFVMDSKKSLRQHYVTVHNNDGKFVCKKCRKSCRTEDQLRAHLLIKNCIFKCNMCQIRCYSPRLLNIHVQHYCRARKSIVHVEEKATK